MGMRWPSSETSLLLQQTCKQPCFQPICTFCSTWHLHFLRLSRVLLPESACFLKLLPTTGRWLPAFSGPLSQLPFVHLPAGFPNVMTSFKGCNFLLSFFCPYGFRSFFKNPITVILAGALGETVEVRECAQSFHGSLEVIYPFFSFNKCWGAPAPGTVSRIS